ncbi:hypothetical protein [Lentzea kentuckyensis]|uniref:hypothetical protein n=1 Tax=Lentzea kentuckyensis TaxID=360086 RepID=UPI000A37D228|nr:hypothetical protein [Lentzea kentuckyensis]
MRLALSLLLVLAGCTAAPADPVALLGRWLDTIREQESVRFKVEIEVEGDDPRRRTFAGVMHVNRNGGAVAQQDVTAHVQQRYGVTDYRAVSLDQDVYLQHDDLTLPPGKTFARLETQGMSWCWNYLTDLSLAEIDYHPGNVFRDLDRETIRLVAHDDNRFEFSAGGTPHSGSYVQGDVRLVVLVDDEDRVVRAERSGPSVDRQRERSVAEYSQWGTAADVLRPVDPSVAKAAEVVVHER